MSGCLLFGVAIIFCACSKDGEPSSPHADRVVLVYMAGDNNLAGYVQDNIAGMVRGMASATASLFSAALAADPEALAEMDLGQVQPLDRYRRHFLLDAGSVVLQLERRGAEPSRLRWPRCGARSSPARCPTRRIRRRCWALRSKRAAECRCTFLRLRIQT